MRIESRKLRRTPFGVGLIVRLTVGLTLCTALLATAVADPAAAQIPASERAALVALYEATDGDNWFNADDPGQPTGWLGAAGTECSWAGVLCDPDETTVEALFLSGYELFGPLPPDIADLPNLFELVLDSNFLEGPIPPALGELRNLEVLDLFDNFFTGTIPAELGDLTGLFELYLDFNFLEGPIPGSLTNLRRLEVLVLAENFLSGPLPSGLAGLQSLLVLDLYDNDLSGPIPASLSQLRSLEILDLGFNQLSGTVPEELEGMLRLEVLLLDSNQLTGPLPDGITLLPALEEADLRWNGLAIVSASDSFSELVGEDVGATQTRPPTQLSGQGIDGGSILLTWTPMSYTTNDGGYIVQRSNDPSGPFSTVAIVEGKTTRRVEISGLPAGSSHFVIRSFTEPHEANPGTVVSEATSAITATPVTGAASGVISFVNTSIRATEGETRRVLMERTRGSSGFASAVLQAAGNLPAGLQPIVANVEWADGEAGLKAVEIPIPLLSGGPLSFDIELLGAVGASLGRRNATVSVGQKDLVSNGQASLASSGDQPRAERGRSGRKVTVWSAPDGDGRGVFAQRYDAAGNPLGTAMRLNQNVAGAQSQPSVAVDDAGGFVAVWRETTAAGSRVVGRFFSPQGSATGGQFVASSAGTDAGSPDVALKPNGEAYVVWERRDDEAPALSPTGPELGRRTANDSAVVGRFFAPTGQPMTSETMVSDGSSDAGAPSASTSDDGSVVVAFEKRGSGDQSSVQKADVQPSGNPTGLQTISQAGASASQPSVEHTSSGGTVVVFQQQQAVGGNTKSSKRSSNVVGRAFAPTGQASGGTFSVSGAGTDVKKQPELSTNSNGDCFVVWQSEGAGGSRVDGQALDGCTQPSGSPMTLSSSDQGSPGSPSAVLDDDGSVVTVFTEDDLDEGSRAVTGVRTGATGGGGGGGPTGPCTADAETLCLNNDRFSVRATWRDFQGGTGTAKVEKLTNDTGYFWFFDPDNVEILLKTLDACSFANRFWVFAGGLTSVEVEIVVTDTATGDSKTYGNALGRPFQPVQDTGAFDTCAAGSNLTTDASSARDAKVHWARLWDAVQASQQSSANCSPDGQTLCLNGGRFQVTALWADFTGGTGSGQAIALTPDTGYFWFFGPDNIEVGIKVLDACGFADAYWVFAAGLTNVETELLVTDTETGAIKIYRNTLGVPFAPIQDTKAFATCSG